jgi:Na+-exporting ATPase
MYISLTWFRLSQVNLVTSSFLALGLGMEEASPDIMLRRPHNLRIGVFTRELITDKMIYGAISK